MCHKLYPGTLDDVYSPPLKLPDEPIAAKTRFADDVLASG